LPSGWTDQDIGSVGFAGSASACASSFVLQGGGADIWGGSDAFNFASASVTGDNALVALVTAVQNTDPWAKGGIMFRNDTTAGSMFADVFISPGNGVNFQWRATTGGQCGSTGGGGMTAPVWVKLARSGTNFTASYGSDGLNWNVLGTTGIPMTSTVRAGLEVTAHNNSALCLAAFDKVATAAPPVPAGLAAFGGNEWVSLNWLTSPAAAGYNVKRSAVRGGPYATIGNPAVNSYLDTVVTNWSTWYYVVSAVNSFGESANSAEVSATPRPPPPLNLSSVSQLSLSWPAWATGYTAYSASNLVPPIPWQRLTNAPQTTPSNFNLPLTPGSAQQFFRLSAP
jgi:hypothetical protein